MHDPSVLVFEVRRPWPRVRLTKTARTGGMRFPYWRRGRIEAYWPGWLDIWHDEPNGRDSGTVCGHAPQHGVARLRWMADHRAHLRIGWNPARTLNRWLFQRCEHCGRASSRLNPVNVSHQWDGPRQRWGRSSPGMFHGQCSSVVHLGHSLDEASEALVMLGVDSRDLELHGMESTRAWRVPYYAAQRVTRNAEKASAS